jgi:hypothetical protein
MKRYKLRNIILAIYPNKEVGGRGGGILVVGPLISSVCSRWFHFLSRFTHIEAKMISINLKVKRSRQ